MTAANPIPQRIGASLDLGEANYRGREIAARGGLRHRRVAGRRISGAGGTPPLRREADQTGAKEEQRRWRGDARIVIRAAGAFLAGWEQQVLVGRVE